MSWSRTFQEDIAYAFGEFCGSLEWQESLYGKLVSRQQLINEWLHGATEEVIQLTGGDPDTWLEAVLIIIDAYGKDPAIISYRSSGPDGPSPCERQVERILDFEEWGAPFLDRRIYRKLAAGGE